MVCNVSLSACSLVIMEGDPHPGAVVGRMSFQSFNPSIDVSILVNFDLKNFPFGNRLLSLISQPCLGRNWMKLQTFFSNQKHLLHVLAINLLKIQKGQFILNFDYLLLNHRDILSTAFEWLVWKLLECLLYLMLNYTESWSSVLKCIELNPEFPLFFKFSISKIYGCSWSH